MIQSLRSQNPNANQQNSSLNYSNNPSQEQTDDVYYGKIQLINENNSANKNEPTYQFGLFSLNDKRLYLQQGDLISFQLIDLTDINNKKFAYNIQLIQQQSSANSQSDMTSVSSSSRLRAGASGEYKKGKIDSIKGHSGHIEYSVGNGGDYKKVYFHISDVILDSNNNNNTQNQNGEQQVSTSNGSTSSSNNSSSLKPGDDVEFLVSHNPRNGKYTATRIRRTSTSISSNLSQAKTSNSSSNQLSSMNTNSNNGSSTNLISSDNATTTEKRPERLITKLKTANIDNISGKMLILIRQPNNPDSKIKSFSRQLKERLPGSLTPLADQTGVVANNNNNNSTNQQQSSSSIVDPLVDSTNN